MDHPPQEDTKVCPYCAETIKKAAIVCRYCGRELAPMPPPQAPRTTPQRPTSAPSPATTTAKKTKKGPNALGWAFFALLIIAGGCGLLFAIASSGNANRPPSTPFPTRTPTPNASQIKESAIELTYDDLARNTENHIGKTIHFRGDVLQVMESDWSDATDLRVMFEDGDAVYVNYTGPRVLEDDTVDIYAKVDGRLTYEAVFGNSVTIPEVTALELEVVEE